MRAAVRCWVCMLLKDGFLVWSGLSFLEFVLYELIEGA